MAIMHRSAAKVGRGVAVVFIACSLISTGCISGAVYTNTTMPIDVNFDETPSHRDSRRGDLRGSSWKTLVIPLVVAQGQLQIDWGDSSISSAMREAGIERAHYADIQTLSVLGLWTQRWVHVYGE
jgi:hypothetical protein